MQFNSARAIENGRRLRQEHGNWMNVLRAQRQREKDEADLKLQEHQQRVPAQ
jgi:hypothetical protein